MRFLLALVVACVGLPAFDVGHSRAESGTVWDQLPDSNSPDLLLGPTQGRRKPDETRNLSAPPSSTPPSAADPGASREISPSERQELLQNRTRESPYEWRNSRDRN